MKVLHIAPEQCFVKRFKALKHLDYYTADLESPIADIKLDVMKMPLPDESFDMVMCNHVMEHVPDDRQAMGEVYRVLRHGGFAILQVPLEPTLEHTYEDPSITDPKEREKHFLQKDHVRLYGRDYASRLRSVGFNVTEDALIDELETAEQARFCLPKGEIVYFCKKD